MAANMVEDISLTFGFAPGPDGENTVKVLAGAELHFALGYAEYPDGCGCDMAGDSRRLCFPCAEGKFGAIIEDAAPGMLAASRKAWEAGWEHCTWADLD